MRAKGKMLVDRQAGHLAEVPLHAGNLCSFTDAAHSLQTNTNEAKPEKG